MRRPLHGGVLGTPRLAAAARAGATAAGLLALLACRTTPDGPEPPA